MIRIHALAAAGLALAATTTLSLAASAVATPSVETRATLAQRGQVAASGTVVAVTQIDGESAQLLVGKGGSLPAPVEAIKSLPAWGQPHIGTDAARKPVVVYPHCADVDHVKSCDLRVYSVLTGSDAAVAGVNRPGVGETEGSMDRGAVAFTRWTADGDPSAASLASGGALATRTTLVYRAVGTRARVLTTEGGQQISLDRGRILQVRDAEPGYGICGRAAVEVVRADGGARRTLESHGCGLNSQAILSPVFVGSSVMWALRGIDDMQIERVSASGGKVETAPVPGGFSTAVPTARSSAILIDGPWLSEAGSPEERAGPWELKRATGLAFR